MDSAMWEHMFALVIPVMEKILRPMIVYIALIIGLRLAGKRELAQMNTFDLIVLLTISNTVQNAIIGEDTSVTGGLIGAATLLAINFVVVRFVYSNRKIETIVEGNEEVLISGGKISTNAMKNEVITVEELEIAARKQGFTSLKEVEKAVLEPNGSFSFVEKQPKSEEARHRELLHKLDKMSLELAALRGEMAKNKAK